MPVILKETKDNILKITLNRPEVMNAFNSAMLSELQKALKEAESDEIRCIILTGNGKGFCSGQDLKDFEKEKRSFKEALDEKYNPLIRQISELNKPVICGINGTAAGAGLSLALACDFRIAVETASLIEIFINVGLVTDSGSSFFLPKTIGLSRAFSLCSMADKLSAQEAYEESLIHVLVSNNYVLNIALDKYSKKFAAMPTKAIGYIKKLLQYGVTTDLNTVLEREAYYQDLAGNSEDYKEGVNSFIEKRQPQFKGK